MAGYKPTVPEIAMKIIHEHPIKSDIFPLPPTDITILTDLSGIYLGIKDGNITVQVPRLKLGQTLSINLTLTLRSQPSYKFFTSPETMTLRVVGETSPIIVTSCCEY